MKEIALLKALLTLPASPKKVMMSAKDFKEMKSKLRQKRLTDLTETLKAERLSPDDAKWCTTPGPPQRPPPSTLVAYDNENGGTLSVFGIIGAGFTGRVNLIQGDMISYAYQKASTHSIAVLNMANASTPGGGFLSGARAQEEQLCHRSTLFPRLKLLRYKGQNNGYPIKRGTALITPNVRIHLREAPDFVRIDPMNVTVISAAAEHHNERDASFLSLEDFVEELKPTWVAILTAGMASNAHELVVSAIGAGAFNNPPVAVGRAFAEALRVCPSGTHLKLISVVIMEDHNSGGRNLEDFIIGYGYDSLSIP